MSKQTREEIEQLRQQQPVCECAYCYRKLPRITRNSEDVYVVATHPYAPFCRLACALEFARAAHEAGCRISGKGRTDIIVSGKEG